MKKSLSVALLRWMLIGIACGIMTGSENTMIGAAGSIPDILFSFQQPSYVTNKDSSLDAFICDPEKAECKINFDLTPSFTGGFRSSDFVCHIAGIDPVESGKCNPNTVIFGSGITDVIFTITDKTDVTLSRSRSIQIQNGVTSDGSSTGTTSSGSGETASGSLDSSSGVIVIFSGTTDSGGVISGSGVLDSGSGDIVTSVSGSTETISGSIFSDSGVLTSTSSTLPRIQFVFQQATYLLDKNPDLTDYFCDSGKAECKVNFDFTPSFTGGFRESDFLCHIDGITESESGKCNPNQVIFGTGITTVTVNIYEKLHPENNVSRPLFIHGIGDPNGSLDTSSGAIVEASGGLTESGAVTASTDTGVVVPEPIIEIQSGLSTDFTCNQKECIINLNGEASFASGSKMTDYTCSWSFSGAVSVSTTETCNPSYVHYLPGMYEVSFRITSKIDPSRYREKNMQIRNIYTPLISGSASGGGSTQNNIPPRAVITPQGPWSKNKYIRDGEVICHTDTGACSVNFTGEESTAENKSKLRYFWDFGNNTTSTLANPGSSPLPLGTYTVKLRIINETGNTDESTYSVRILLKEKESLVAPPFIDPGGDHLQITRVSPNPIGSDVLEWVEIWNPFSEAKNLDECMLRDASGKKYHFSREEKISGEGKRKFFSIMTGLSLSNTKETLTLICDEREVSQVSWDHQIRENEVVESYSASGGYLSASGAILEEGDGFLGLDPVDIDELSRFLIGPRGSAEKRQKFVESTTTFSLKQGSGSEINITGRGFPGAEIQLAFASGSMMTGSGLNEYFSGSQTQIVSGSGVWGQENILPPGKYEAILRVRISGADSWHILKKRKTIVMQAVRSKRMIVRSKKIIETTDAPAKFFIKLQAGRSKKIMFSGGKIICHDKKCGVNLQIEETRKKTFVYEWDFGGKNKIYGENPKTFSFTAGDHVVILKALNIETGELLTEKIPVSIVPPPKKTRKKKLSKISTHSKKSTLQIRPSFSESERKITDKTPLVAYVFLIMVATTGFGHLAWKRWGVREIDSTFGGK